VSSVVAVIGSTVWKSAYLPARSGTIRSLPNLQRFPAEYPAVADRVVVAFRNGRSPASRSTHREKLVSFELEAIEAVYPRFHTRRRL
jgi:hypothetical protein